MHYKAAKKTGGVDEHANPLLCPRALVIRESVHNVCIVPFYKYSTGSYGCNAIRFVGGGAKVLLSSKFARARHLWPLFPRYCRKTPQNVQALYLNINYQNAPHCP
jgi:hypothetical protein